MKPQQIVGVASLFSGEDNPLHPYGCPEGIPPAPDTRISLPATASPDGTL